MLISALATAISLAAAPQHASAWTLPHRDCHRGALQPGPAGAGAAAVARQPGPAHRRHQPRQVLLRGPRPRERTASSTRAASPPSTASGRRPTRRARCARTFSESLRFPAPGAAGPGDAEEARRAANAFREVWTSMVDPKDRTWTDARPTVARAAARAPQERRPPNEGGPAHPRRRLHRGRARQVREGRAPAGGRPLRPLAVQGAASGLQRLGALPAVARVGHLAPAPPASTAAAASGATYDAFGSERYVLTFDNRSLPRRGLVRALRVRRDPGRTATPTAAAESSASTAPWPPTTSGRRYVFVHEFGHHFAGAGRRVLHLRDRLPARRGPPRALGAQRHRAQGPAALKWKALRLARARRCPPRGPRTSSRPQRAKDPGAAQEDPRRPPAGVRDGRALHRAADGRRRAPRGRPARGQGGRVRGREVRGHAATTGPQMDCIMFTRDAVPVLPRSASAALDADRRPLLPPLIGCGEDEHPPLEPDPECFQRSLNPTQSNLRIYSGFGKGKLLRGVSWPGADPLGVRAASPNYSGSGRGATGTAASSGLGAPGGRTFLAAPRYDSGVRRNGTGPVRGPEERP